MPEKTTHKPSKPFGADKAHALLLKEEAIRTLPRQVAFDRGYLTVKDLDDEELRYGRCRDENGYIPRTKGKTELIPIHRYDEMIAEHELRFKQKLRQNLDDMIDIVVSIAKDDTAEPRDRLEAARTMIDRTVGKAPDTVQVTVTQKPYEELLNGITGVGAISRAEHRRMQQEAGEASGIIDVEFDDIPEGQTADSVPSEGVPFHGQSATKSHVVQVHQARPGEQPGTQHATAETFQEPVVGQEPNAREYVNGEPTFRQDPASTTAALQHPTVDVVPAPHEKYGSRRTENQNYAEQAREAAKLAERRKAAKEQRRQALVSRKEARKNGADAITEPEITGAAVDEFGNLTFEQD